MSQDAPVFTSPSGSQVWPASFRGRAFAGACKAAGLNPLPTPHVLRHTAASMMARAAWPESYMRQALGHGSAEITRCYIHLCDRAHDKNRNKLAALLVAESAAPRSS